MNTGIIQRSAAGLVAGGALVATGILLVLHKYGLLQSFDLGRSWPLIVVVLAFGRLAATIKETHQRGWTLLIIGDWLLVNTMTEWTYVQFTAPLLLGGMGLLMILRAVGDQTPKSAPGHYAR
jgi:hypothetical protein